MGYIELNTYILYNINAKGSAQIPMINEKRGILNEHKENVH